MSNNENDLDSGWVELIVAAKKLGLSYDEVKDFFRTKSIDPAFIKSQMTEEK
ncbi:anti-repressor SinI family protein [Halalkalibacter krulwichiae]|uniref:Anti-repressor SinI n=1 Tax=Halalkalibacter krulwichiae TaxID=199441 RepID=A0A1X9MH94_9BACI|nr:anti-repressor SinI family protein [Halalkalibacter krulwichiae]ARK32839.1 Anti-repressor SinI [Halalkalibacter krulwichiae]